MARSSQLGEQSINNGDAVILNSILRRNSAVNGGGALRIENSASTLVVVNTLINHNESAKVGGVIDQGNGTSTFVNSTMAGNLDTGEFAYRTAPGW